MKVPVVEAESSKEDIEKLEKPKPKKGKKKKKEEVQYLLIINDCFTRLDYRENKPRK